MTKLYDELLNLRASYHNDCNSKYTSEHERFLAQLWKIGFENADVLPMPLVLNDIFFEDSIIKQVLTDLNYDRVEINRYMESITIFYRHTA